MNTKQTQKMIDVLVIDDDESICEGCRQTLEEVGYKVTIARDGSQGLYLVNELRPKVVIIDLKMPGISGIDVLEKISEMDPTIVLIATSGYGFIDSANVTKKMGAFDFLAKPFEPEKLVETVNRGINWSKLQGNS